MLNSLDASSQRFLSELAQTSRRAERAQRQVSSGLRIENASDDPDNVSPMLELRAYLEQTRQTKLNLGRVKAEVDTSEQALENAASVLDRASVLGAQGVTGTQTAETRKMIASEVDALLQQLVGISGTMVEGRYVFSGDNDQTPPYSVDPAQPHGVSTYLGTATTRQTFNPNGTRFSIARTAEDIFDDPVNGHSVFGAVNSLKAALEANDEPAMRNALEDLRGASDHMNSQLAYYGSVQNRVQEASDSASTMETRLTGEVSDIESADVTAAIVEMNQAQFQQQASLASRAQLPKTSLFDYLG